MNIKKILKMFFIDYFLYWMGSFIVTLALIFLFMALEPIIAAIITFLYYPLMMLAVGAKYHDRLDTISEYEQNNHSKYTMYLYYGITAAYIILFVFFLAVCGGNVTDKRMLFSLLPVFPFSPLILLCHIFSTGIFDITDYYPYIYLLFFSTFLVIFTADIVYAKQFKNNKIGYIILLFILSIPICLLLNTKPLSDEQKYGGHGFDYMNGFSSTDFTGYHVYDGEKLATLDHESSLIIENEEDMPVLDGAEACYPLYSAVARTIYKDIDNIESNHSDHDYYNGKIVTFTNTVYGYERLTDKEVDLIFAARPSSDQKEYA
ncbi:MAG: hypothetical protein IJ736_04530, partial [Firmicutes bacterium]|nr:hypothetical protein [Bacillota bacterium]